MENTLRPYQYGDTVLLKASPTKLPGFTSHVRQYGDMPVVHFVAETSAPAEALRFTLVSPDNSSGVIRTGDPVVLRCDQLTVSVLSDSRLVTKVKHPTSTSSDHFMFCADHLPTGVTLTEGQVLYLTKHLEPWSKVGLPSNGPFWNLVINWDALYPTVFSLSLVSPMPATQVDTISFLSSSQWTLDTVSGSSESTTSSPSATLPLIIDPPTHAPKEIMLTIDDFGVTSEDYLKSVIDYLDTHQLPSLWFANGTAASHNPEAVKHVIRSRYAEIGIHTYTHANMGVLGVPAATKEIADCLRVMKALHSECGKPNWYPRFFRFPFLDDGGSQGPWVQAGLQGMLRTFGFQPSKIAQQTMPYTAHTIDVDGVFLNDGPFKEPSRSDTEFDAFLHRSFAELGTSMPTLFLRRCILGCHDHWKLLRLIRFLNETCHTVFLPIE